MVKTLFSHQRRDTDIDVYKRQVYENISTADRGGLYVGIAVGTVCLLWLAGSFIPVSYTHL